VAKHSQLPAAAARVVRTRRAYFDSRFGQLHVRTAFPTTGGFDEGVPLLCLHPSETSSRAFDRFLPEIADDRSVYAPDLPGCGESDGAPSVTFGDSVGAVEDLAADLRLRQIDVLGFRFGAGVALALGAARPELVRRLVLVGVPPIDGLPVITQESLILRVKLGAADNGHWAKFSLPNARMVDLPDYAADLFEAAPKTLAKQISAFLKA
jgi:pimeloyl-ACP methyl ester carboxylesterase